jgi:hypothetical protein
MALPELRPVAAGPIRWSFQVVDRLDERPRLQLLGEEPIYSWVSAKLFRHDAGYRIAVDDTGAYDILNDNRDISWQPNPDPWWDFGRSHLIGRVLATSLQLSGTVTLHASGVEMADGVVGFLAPKRFGKSTLAMTLFRAGARFVTDDALAIDTRDAVRALPGIQSLRVRLGSPDAEQWIAESVEARQGRDGEGALPPFPSHHMLDKPSVGRDGKAVLPPFPPHRVLDNASVLSALYFVRPKNAASAQLAADRSRVPEGPAAFRLVGQVKIAAMLGSSFAPVLLEETGNLAASVPVFDLSVVRDLERLPEVVDRLVEWHGLPEPTGEPRV